MWPFAKMIALCMTLCLDIALRTRSDRFAQGGGRRAQGCAQGVHVQGMHKVCTKYAQGTHKGAHKVELNLVHCLVCAQGTTALCVWAGHTGRAQGVHMQGCNVNW